MRYSIIKLIVDYLDLSALHGQELRNLGFRQRLADIVNSWPQRPALAFEVPGKLLFVDCF